MISAVISAKLCNSPLSRPVAPACDLISPKNCDSSLAPLLPASWIRLRTPINPSDFKVAAELAIPIPSNAFCACLLGATISEITFLILVIAVSLLTPCRVRVASAPCTSSNETPAFAAIGITLPKFAANSATIVLPLSWVTINWSTILPASLALFP